MIGSECTAVGIMCTLGDTAASGKESYPSVMGTWTTRMHKWDPFGGLLAYLPILRIADRMKTPPLLSDGI